MRNLHKKMNTKNITTINTSMLLTKKMYYQKITLLLFVLFTYVLIVVYFVIYQKIFCKTYSIIEFYKKDDIDSCMIIRYLYTFYQLVTVLVLLLTIIASYIIIFSKSKQSTVSNNTKDNILVFIPMYSENINEINNTLNSVLLNENQVILYIVVDGIKKGIDNDDFTSNYIKQILNVTNNVSNSNSYELYIGKFHKLEYILLIKNINKGKKDSFILCVKSLYYNNNITEINENEINENEINENEINEINENEINENENEINENENENEINENENDLLFFKDIGNYINLVKIEYILMLDTDTKVNSSGISILSDYLDSNLSSAAVCGRTSVINKKYNILTMSQVFEYYITHYTLKAAESIYGNVLVLSGCFTLYRKHILLNPKLINLYKKENNKSLYTANISQLGEDRLLTNLILRLYPTYNTSYTEKAKCHTQVPTSFKTILCQRRRWTNSLIFCNFMLLFNTPKYNILKKFGFLFVVLYELFVVFYLPILIFIGYYYLTQSIYNYIIAPDNIILIISIIFLFLPVVLCIIFMKPSMIKYAIAFILLLPFYNIIPLYSLCYTDDVSWGDTRKIIEIEEIKPNTIIEIEEIEPNIIKIEEIEPDTIIEIEEIEPDTIIEIEEIEPNIIKIEEIEPDTIIEIEIKPNTIIEIEEIEPNTILEIDEIEESSVINEIIEIYMKYSNK